MKIYSILSEKEADRTMTIDGSSSQAHVGVGGAGSIGVSQLDNASLVSVNISNAAPAQLLRQPTSKRQISFERQNMHQKSLEKPTNNGRISPKPVDTKYDRNASAMEMASMQTENDPYDTSPQKAHNHEAGSTDGGLTQIPEAASTSQEETIRNRIHGIDKNLVKIMQRIEVKSRHKLEEYKELLEKYGHNKKFMHKLNTRLKDIEQMRKDERLEAAKQREMKLIEERKQRNIEKMKKKENVVGDIYKRMTYRSPQPAVRVFKKKVIQTKDE